ncbi:MAG: hypothetical protein LQ349_005414 [Xanthoria aureola]|nr:MAG: hypothetical protein LQ349_005414 [Xanthoria aureola]
MMMLEPIRGPPETHSLHTHDSTTDSTLDCACHLGSSIASCSTATQRTAIPPSLASPKSPVPAPPDSRQADPFDRTCHTAPYTLARYAEELPTLRPARVQGESRHAGSANAGVQLKGRKFKYSSLPPTTGPSSDTEPTPRGPPAPTTQNPPPPSSPSFVVAPPTRDVPRLRLEPSPNSGCQFGEFPTQPSTLTSGLGTDASSTADELLQSLPDLVPSRAPGTAFCWRGRTGAAA